MGHTADIKKLVVLRLEAMPKNIAVSLGSYGDLSKNQLIEHVVKEDALGKKIIEMQLAYLKSMKDLND